METSTCEENRFKMNDRKKYLKSVVFIDESSINTVTRMLVQTFHTFITTSISWYGGEFVVCIFCWGFGLLESTFISLEFDFDSVLFCLDWF